MSRTLQIIELLIAEMEKHPGRYKIEITTAGICFTDYQEFGEKKRLMPEYYFHFYEAEEDYQIECNKMFEEYIGGLKA